MQDDSQCGSNTSFSVGPSSSVTLIIVLCFVIPLAIIGILFTAGMIIAGNIFHFCTRKAYSSSSSATPQTTNVTIVQNPVIPPVTVQYINNPGEATAPPPKITGTATEFTPSAPPETAMKWGRVV